MRHIKEKTFICMLYVHLLRGLEGDIMNLRLLLLYRLQWVKLRFHQHYPANMHRILQCHSPDRKCVKY